MRDKLIELIQNAVGGCARHWAEFIVGNADDEYVSNEYGFELVNWRYFPVDYKHRGETAQENVLYWLKQPVEADS